MGGARCAPGRWVVMGCPQWFYRFEIGLLSIAREDAEGVVLSEGWVGPFVSDDDAWDAAQDAGA